MSLLTLGAGLHVGAGGGGGFTPATLGASLWMENDPAKLYTDAGSTLVSADAQAVQQANDKSGNNRHFSQATLASRPLYKVGPKPYLLFDHTNDSMVTGDFTGIPDANGQMLIAIAAQVDSLADFEGLFSGGYARMRCISGPLSAASYSAGYATLDADDTAASITAGVPFVGMVQITTTSIETFINNVSDGATALTPGNRQTAADHVTIGSVDSTTAWLGGRVYGIAAIPGIVSSGNRALMQTYMAGLYT